VMVWRLPYSIQAQGLTFCRGGRLFLPTGGMLVFVSSDIHAGQLPRCLCDADL
jgi:hypothetical protein